MKTKILILFLLTQSVCFAQEIWHPLGEDDFNRATCGSVTLAGRKPIIVKNDHVFLFNIQTPDYLSTNSRFSISKYAGNQWEHIDFPFLFSSTPVIDGAVDNNEIPYVLFNDVTGTNLPIVKKFVNGSWTDVGTGISTVSSSFLNIVIGTDNLPQILFREGNVIKLKKFDGSNWVLLSETTEFIPYSTISLELDNNNIPYVLSNYQVGTTYNCFVKKFNGTTWEEVGITGFIEYGSLLVFDNFNVPHMFVGRAIKKFNGSAWVNISTPLSFPMFAVSAGLNLYFNNSNDLYACFSGTLYTNPMEIYVKKLVGTTWQSIISNGFIYDKVYTVSGDSVYHVSFGTDNYPDIFKTGGGQTLMLGGSSFSSGNGSHDFSICNGIPLVAYIKGYKASVNMFVDDNWTNLGALQISENEVSKVIIKSGTDGIIYLAYNNELSSTPSDTKLTVKKLTLTGWVPVGAVNFSQSAGAEFDFKLSHVNEPYVLYMSGRVQKFDGTNWVYIGGSAYTGDTEARLALDVNDLPYIAFKDPSNSGRIAVKRLNGNVWEYVDQAGLAAYTGQHYRPRIVIDASNNIYLGFTDSSFRVHIKKLNNGVWESVGPDSFTTGKTEQYEIAVDHNNVLYIVYNELENNFRREAKVKKFNGTIWEFVGEPNFSPTSIIQAKIDFWGNNTPIVAYRSLSNYYSSINTRFFGEESALDVSEHLSVNESQWLLTPNPVTNTFSINRSDEIQSLEIYDLTGKKIVSKNENFTNIDVSFLSSGMYIIRLKTDSGMRSIKLVKN
ncbi:MAG: T9SS type A sorting domain-containing protein [Bacteroidota bacterium]